ncbi:hypothetical protein M947_02615 [Sulfurimonas hongkongensis]|uniref:Uncharacterized protein n=1 Tax=Sulfurimonas hongkongensis TaxID=1172190 RepID=T0JTH4_9BACT|nr:hypothetical protein [Sulfurimonas hongkongensis]EQB40247.1 hypothetical protein M947_02615 [Sulfurimonas hongkongensis]
MKPLLAKNLENFCSRFDNFIDAEFRSIEILSKSVIRVVITTQDSSRDFDWVTITLEFNDVSDAGLIKNDKLSFVDMSNGLTLLSSDGIFVFGVGNYDDEFGIKNALCYIISSSIKYKEGQF